MALEAIVNAGFDVVAALTRPDRPAGRGLRLHASPVKEFAARHGLPVLQPKTLKNVEAQAELSRYGADIMVVAAYGMILPQAVLSIPRHGCLNIHASLLPRWRGAAPIQRALLAGDAQTGISIMQLDAGLDTGPVARQAAVSIEPDDTTHQHCRDHAQDRLKQLRVHVTIEPDDTAGTLHDKLAIVGAREILVALETLRAGKSLKASPQDDSAATYAHKIESNEACIDWTQSARTVDRQIRALNPAPGAWTLHAGSIWKLWRAEPMDQTGQPGEVLAANREGIVVACGSASVRVLELQRAGGKRLNAGVFLAGCPLSERELLGG